MAFWQWSQTASANASADPSVNWAEGQAPSSINDSARAMMAVLAKERDDISGAIVTGGSSTAYTLSSFSNFSAPGTGTANLSGQVVAFSPHTTNAGGPVTINVDGIGAKPLRSSPGIELQAGTIIQGTPYVALYNSTDGAFYLQGFVGNPYNIPLGAGMDYWLPTAPNSSFVFPIGQAISRATYVTLFTAMGTTYGVGDGSTTFNLPDKTGRVSAMIEATATRLTSSFFGTSTVLGNVGGAESLTLTTAQMPAHTHANTLSDPGHSHLYNNAVGGGYQGGATPGGVQVTQNTNASVTGITLTNAPQGGGAAHRTVQPTIICNYIMRII